MARLIRCSGCTRRPNGCQIRRRFRPRPKRLSWRLQPPQRPPPATDTSRPRRQPGCTHPLSLSSFTAKRKKNKNRHSHPTFSFFVRSLGASHPLPVARRGKISSIVAVFLSFTRKNNKNKKKIFFFFHISKADYCVSWFLFQCDAYPSFLFLEKKNKKIAIQTQTSIPLKPRLLFLSTTHGPVSFFFYRSNSRINRWLLKFVCPVVNSIRKQTKKKNVESSVIEINNLIETNNKRERERKVPCFYFRTVVMVTIADWWK